mmetsp:Transcript_3862/g.4695  ORF Transcript_3862/g.4695 Transcript_3862/m.4695 type:complete len:326 (-) Transcript_3862:972-1949(-)
MDSNTEVEVKAIPEENVKAEGKADEKVRREEANQTCCQTCKSFITPKSILAAIVWCGMASLFIWLFISGTLEDLRETIEDLGYWGYFIFFCMLILVGMPFGWGYQATTITVGFVYGWPGLILVQLGTHVGAAISFFGVRYFARDFVQDRIDRLQPKLQLIVKKLEVFATKNWRTAYPFMIGARQTPITFGLTNSIFALTDVTYIRFFITTLFGTMIEAPISINIGILLSEAAKANDESDDVGVNGTEIEADTEGLESISLIISATVTAIVFFGTAFYSWWFVKQLTGVSEGDIWEEIERIDNEDEEEIDNLFSSPASVHETEQSL